MLLRMIVLLAALGDLGRLAQRAPVTPKVGSPAPTLTLSTVLQAPAGTVPSWRALKGKIVVLEFWATWCGPCVEQISHLNALAEKFKDKQVQFISITDEDEKQVSSFLRSRPIAGWIGLDPHRATFKAYDVVGIPTTFLVGRGGAIVAFTSPDQVTEDVLEDVLAGRTPKVASATLGPAPPLVSRGSTKSELPALVDILIRPSDPAGFAGMSRGKGKYQARLSTVREAISQAFEISPVRIIASTWSDERKYDFLIQMPAESDSLLMPLFQQALAAAFRFKARREPRLTDVYLLAVPKGGAPNLKLSSYEGGSSANWGAGKLKTKGSSVEDLAFHLEKLLRQPVIDETGLKGRYDVELTWDAKKPETMLNAVRDQLGLELSPARTEIQMLIVETAEPAAPR